MGFVGKLRVDVRDLERQDAVLDRQDLPGALGLHPDEGMTRGPLAVHAEVAKSGETFLVKGWVSGILRQTCDLCLRKFEAPFKSFFDSHYLRSGGGETGPDVKEKELTGDEEETVLFDGDWIDLSDEVRQAVEMAVPMRALCREDCKGLCAGCGADLNRESCRCPDPPGDDRWSALKDFKPDR